MTFRNWQSIRADFNHQWLANNYLTQLRYWVEEIQQVDGESDASFEQSLLTKTLPQWQHRSEEAAWIVNNAIEKLTPKRLFGELPLCRIPDDIREPVAIACHYLWLQRTKDVRDRASNAVKCVDCAYKALMNCLEKCPIPLSRRSFKRCAPCAVKFLQACEELNSALEVLPKCAYW